MSLKLNESAQEFLDAHDTLAHCRNQLARAESRYESAAAEMNELFGAGGQLSDAQMMAISIAIINPEEEGKAKTRPQVLDAITEALREGPKTTADVFSFLERRGWMPESSDPKTYIYFCLSNNPNNFERASNMPKGYFQLVNASPEESVSN